MGLKDEEISKLETQIQVLKVDHIAKIESLCEQQDADYQRKVKECERLESSYQYLQSQYNHLASESNSHKKALDTSANELQTPKS